MRPLSKLDRTPATVDDALEIPGSVPLRLVDPAAESFLAEGIDSAPPFDYAVLANLIEAKLIGADVGARQDASEPEARAVPAPALDPIDAMPVGSDPKSYIIADDTRLAPAARVWIAIALGLFCWTIVALILALIL